MKVVFTVTKGMTGGAYSLLTNIAQPGDAGVPMHITAANGMDQSSPPEFI
jgi:hypothetical protein